MWKDKIQDRYPWAKIKNELDGLIYELSKAEDEEEIELSMLHLHYGNKEDMKFFTKIEREKVKKLMAILIKDTERHQMLLGEAVKELQERRKIAEQKEKGNENIIWSI